MGGSKAGGKAAAKTNKAKHGDGFYANIGALGGVKSRGGGFSANRELARMAGAIGGRRGRRGPQKANTEAVQPKPTAEMFGMKFCKKCNQNHFLTAWPHGEGK
jgi:hypothetical protein